MSQDSSSESDVFYKDGLRFSCAQCSCCCRGEPGFVFLSQADLDALSAWAGVTQEQFIRMYCRWVRIDNDGEMLSLREKKDNDCVFWADGCKAYEARPVQCRTYPFWDHVMESRESWDAESADCSGSCPGINHGELHSKEAIEAELEKYRNIEVLRRHRPVF